MPSRAAGANYQLLREVDHLQEVVGDPATIMRADGLLPSIARAAARLCQTPLAAISLLSKDVQQLELVSVVGTAGLISEKMLPIEGSLNGMVIDSARPFYSADVWHDPRSITRAIARRNKTRAVLIVPLARRAGLVGTLVVANREPQRFSRHEEGVLRDFADVATAAMGECLLRAQLWDAAAHAMTGGAGRFAVTEGVPPAPADSTVGHRTKECHRLTPREHDIVALLMVGQTCKEVAAELTLSVHTVQHYIERLKLRLGQKTLHGLVSSLGRSEPSLLSYMANGGGESAVLAG